MSRYLSSTVIDLHQVGQGNMSFEVHAANIMSGSTTTTESESEVESRASSDEVHVPSDMGELYRCPARDHNVDLASRAMSTEWSEGVHVLREMQGLQRYQAHEDRVQQRSCQSSRNSDSRARVLAEMEELDRLLAREDDADQLVTSRASSKERVHVPSDMEELHRFPKRPRLEISDESAESSWSQEQDPDHHVFTSWHDAPSNEIEMVDQRPEAFYTPPSRQPSTYTPISSSSSPSRRFSEDSTFFERRSDWQHFKNWAANHTGRYRLPVWHGSWQRKRNSSRELSPAAVRGMRVREVRERDEGYEGDDEKMVRKMKEIKL